jgi:hypothetical protein
MSPLLAAVGWITVAVCAVVIVRHHLGYFRRARPLSFGAFLETSGWMIILLVAVGAFSGGLARPGTMVVEVAAAVVGLLFIGIGSSIM